MSVCMLIQKHTKNCKKKINKMKIIEDLFQLEKESGTREGVFCNKCGMSCEGYISNNNGLIETRIHFNGIIKEKVIGGYDSTHIEDGDIYVFSLCERCLMELIGTFKLDAHYGNYLFPTPRTGHWNELTEEKKWHYIGCSNDDEIIDWFGTCTLEFLEKGLNTLTSTDPEKLSERDGDVIKLLKQFLGHD